MCPSLTPKSKKERPQESFQLINTSTYQIYIQEAFKVFERLSMTFLASFLKTETLVRENYFPNAIWKGIWNCGKVFSRCSSRPDSPWGTTYPSTRPNRSICDGIFEKCCVFFSLSAGKDIGFSISWVAERRKVNNESIPDNEVISRGFPCY